MGRPKLPARERRRFTVHIRVNLAEKRALRNEGRAAGVKMLSRWIRVKLLQGLPL